MADGVLRFGPHPVAPLFDARPSPEQVARVETLAGRILQEEPDLPATGNFGAGVAPGLLDSAPTLHLHDIDRPFRGDAPSMREHRALLLARDGDLVVLSRPSSDFVDYCRDDLGLGRVEVRVPRPTVRRRHLALNALHDPDLCERASRAARIAGGLNVVPYQATGGIWALAGVIARLAEVPVRVGGPPPRLSSAVNNKVWFAETVARLLGERALPPTTSASSWAHLAHRVRLVARRRRARVGIKLPSAAGSAGNVVIEPETVLALHGLAAVREYLMDLFAGLEWRDPFPTLVSIWEEPVLDSPSIQGWIPAPDDGAPIVEGVFDQSVVGPVGRFVGSAPTDLPESVQERLVAEGSLIFRLFQRLGWYGRCSLDTILVGDDVEAAAVHWIECNGRWGGTSIPMTLTNRLVGWWNRRPFVSVGGLLQGSRLGFHDIRSSAPSRLFDSDLGRGIVFLTPGPLETGTGFGLMAIGRGRNEARESLAGFLSVLGRAEGPSGVDARE